jgi:osmotically-inducible protein OsmY
MKALKRTAIPLLFSLLLAGVCATSGGDLFGDTGITTRVKTAIFNEPSLKVMDISVSTDERIVTLSGTVKSRAERATAIAVARKVEGVKAVKSDLKVQQ